MDNPDVRITRRHANTRSPNSSLERMVRRFVRWKCAALTFCDYAARLNRSVEVENVLMACAGGKREMLSKEECRQLACKLGVPDEFRPPSVQDQRTARENQKV